MAWYNLDDIKIEHDKGKDEDGNLDLSDKILKRYAEKNNQIIQKVEEIGLPKAGEQLRLITMKPFNTISIISHIAKTEIIEHAIFVIFAINKFAAKVIIDLLIAKRIKKITIVVSSIRNAGHISKSKAVDALKKHTEVIFVNSHAKITLLKTEKNCYNIEGSGNMSFNGRVEQYVIDNDIELYNFSKKWINELLKYKMKPKTNENKKRAGGTNN